MLAMKDNFSRVIDYLRLSVTDRCNLRCIYCMPPDGVIPASHKEILSYEEIVRIVKIAAALGVNKVRLTGGEPLTRRNIVFLISSLKKISGIEDLSMTTNGILLGKYAQAIADAGLDRVNVSVDSLDPSKYRAITRGGDLDLVLRGLSAAKRAGLTPIKINMVPMRGINDNEVADFARLTLETDYHVRFIELMPSGPIHFWSQDKYIASDELKNVIAGIAPLSPVRMRKHGPSRYFGLEGAKGVIGFISALTHHFCNECNRLRMTSDGKLRPCLFSETEIDIKSSIRGGFTDAEIERLLRLSIAVKPKGHTIGGALHGVGHLSHHVAKNACAETESLHRRPMSTIGG